MPVGPGPLRRTLDVVEEELTGANLSLWEEEQLTARLRLALESARRGRRELRSDLQFAEPSRERWRAAAIEVTKERDALLARVSELEEQRDRRRDRLVALQNDALNMRGTLSPNGEERKVPMPLGETLTPAVEWLVDRVAELEAEQQTVYRVVDCAKTVALYTCPGQARKHCESMARAEHGGGSEQQLFWRLDEDTADQPHGPEWLIESTAPGYSRMTGFSIDPVVLAKKFAESGGV